MLNEELRQQLVKNEKEILKLTAEKEKFSQSFTGKHTIDQVMNIIRDKDEELKDISKSMEDLELNFINKERIFKESKSFMDEILKQIREARINNEILK